MITQDLTTAFDSITDAATLPATLPLVILCIGALLMLLVEIIPGALQVIV